MSCINIIRFVLPTASCMHAFMVVCARTQKKANAGVSDIYEGQQPSAPPATQRTTMHLIRCLDKIDPVKIHKCCVRGYDAAVVGGRAGATGPRGTRAQGARAMASYRWRLVWRAFYVRESKAPNMGYY